MTTSDNQDPHQLAAGPVVVGTDGSPVATDAVRWAAAEAAAHGAPLHIVSAIDAPMDFGPGLGYTHIDYDAYRQAGAHIVAAARDVAIAAAPQIAEIGLDTAVAEAPSIPVLRDRSKEARMVVVGTHGYGAIRRGLLGSVSTSLARHAHCPVAVIPQATARDQDRAHGPVVVGVDGSPGSIRALDVAFDEAALRNAPLLAILTWSEFNRYLPRTEMQEEAEKLLDRTLVGYQDSYPNVHVSRLVAAARPAKCLLDAGAHARLIVVGSHGHGGFSGMTLGSVSQAVLHGADGPIIIARPRN